MIKIKKIRFLLVILTLVCFCSCGKGTKPTEVDIQNKMPVQIMYRQNLYKTEMYFKENTLYVSFKNNSSAIDGVSVVVNEYDYSITYNNMTKVFKTKSMPVDNIGIVLFKFFSTNPGTLILTQNDERGFYTKQSSDKYAVVFYQQTLNENKSYYIEIT